MIYDTIIIGAGPAGLSAGIYAKRAGLNALLIEKYIAGGQALNAYFIDNYPGAPGIAGSELMAKMEHQAKTLGCEFETGDVKRMELSDPIKTVYLQSKEYQAKTIILAMGSENRTMGLPGEEKLLGSGLSYCATCDGAFFKGMEVAVIGGGDTAVLDALYLSKLAKNVHIIHRRDQFRAASAYVKALLEAENIHCVYDSVVKAFEASLQLDALILSNVKTNEETRLPVDGAFVAIGSVPQTSALGESIELDGGYIVTNERMHTSAPGVFAAGDVRAKTLRQIVTAAADGALAANEAAEYIIQS